MKLVVGLGNPGQAYEQTRHNVGFRVIDELARRWGAEVRRRRFEGLLGQAEVGGERVLLLKPQTYMNRSGESVAPAVAYYRLGGPDVLVVVDDMALPLGRLRIRGRGGAGGHNGLSSIIACLGTEEFARLRIGIEQVGGERMVDHVLSPFSDAERPVIEQAVQRAGDAVECWVTAGLAAAMNRYNRPEDPASA